jgi:ribosome biogenesis GTPase
VGDWVAISAYDEDKALIHHVFPRKTMIARQAVGKIGELQIIATNIDYAFIVQSVDRDFNINRLERYLTICHTAKVTPIIVLNKIDLIEQADVEGMIKMIKEREKEVLVFPISNATNEGIDQIKETLNPGKTYCLLGSSGVGKSTLLNNLSGDDLMKTSHISESTQRGRHVTTHRELKILENGGIIIDNPGMREVGIADTEGGLEVTFDTIVELSNECKFKDCSHTSEIGCAVIEAIENGEIDEGLYENYLKMKREKEHYESTVAEKRKKDKDFGKMIRQVLKSKKSRKF